MNTVSSKIRLLLLFFLLAGGTGCTLLPFREDPVLTELQEAVRRRMLKLQSADLLSSAAKERYNPQKAIMVLELGSGYQENMWRIDNDPALQVLEEAAAYALILLSRTPEKTAEKLTGDFLDYGTAVRFLELRKGQRNRAGDSASELAMMSNWSLERIKRCKDVPLPGIKVTLFPIHPETERLLNEKGKAAAFQTAAELYRDPSAASLMKCERLRRAILNRVLMQIKSPGAKITPELCIAYWRSRIFSSSLPPY